MDNEAILKVVEILAKAGIGTSIRMNSDGRLVAFFDDGFYKSDGMARLEPENGDVYLCARYNEKTKITSLDDVVSVSHDWYEHSKDRFDGWATPPAHWDRLYKTLA